MPTALITGITGQDGSYLAEFLVSKGYEVHGLVRRIGLSDQRNRLNRISHLLDRITLHTGSLESYASIFAIVEKVRPDELYHLAAQSYVAYSFDDEFSTMSTNIDGTHMSFQAYDNSPKIVGFILPHQARCLAMPRYLPRMS